MFLFFDRKRKAKREGVGKPHNEWTVNQKQGECICHFIKPRESDV